MDYEHIPFRCRRCHEYGHLFKQFPLNATEESVERKEEENNITEANKETEDGFKEVLSRRKSPKGLNPLQPPAKTILLENKNKFKALQEEEMEMEKGDNDEELVELSKEAKEQDTIQINTEQEGEEDNMDSPKDQIEMEVDPQKYKGSDEEQIMTRLLHEWRHLDERFILVEKKQLYKDMFQK